MIRSQVHRSLLDAENAIGKLSEAHPDGWGVAFYVDDSPHIMRSPARALGDQLFHRLSGAVAAETVLAHVRKATKGDVGILNCHPFQYGKWTFVHNGDIPNFKEKESELEALIAPPLRRFRLGTTDSEIAFLIFLTELSQGGPLEAKRGIEDVLLALGSTVRRIRNTCDDDKNQALLTFVVTDGTAFAATQGGKELYVSTYKSQCADREVCPHLSEVCEAPSTTGYVKHFLVSSEPPKGENVWRSLKQGDMIGLDWRMKIHERNVASTKRSLHISSS